MVKMDHDLWSWCLWYESFFRARVAICCRSDPRFALNTHIHYTVIHPRSACSFLGGIQIYKTCPLTSHSYSALGIWKQAMMQVWYSIQSKPSTFSPLQKQLLKGDPVQVPWGLFVVGARDLLSSFSWVASRAWGAFCFKSALGFIS